MQIILHNVMRRVWPVSDKRVGLGGRTQYLIYS